MKRLALVLALLAGCVTEHPAPPSSSSFSIADCAAGKGMLEQTWSVDEGHGAVSTLAFDRGSGRVALAAADHTVKVWDLAAGDVDWSVENPAAVYGSQFPDGASFTALDFGAAGLVTGDVGGRVQLHDPSTGDVLQEQLLHHEDMTAVALDADGARIASASSTFGGNLRVWTLADGAHTGALATQLTSVEAAAFLPDGDLITAGDENGVPLVELRRAADYNSVVASWLGAGDGTVHAVAVSPDGARVAAAGDGFVAIFPATASLGTPALYTDAAYAAQMISFAGSPDLLAVSDRAGDLRLVGADGTERMAADLAGGPTGMAIDRAGQRLIAAGDDGALRVYECVAPTALRR
jgi:WD40 repeat protein